MSAQETEMPRPTLALLWDAQLAVTTVARICTLCKCALAARAFEDAREAVQDALDHLTANELIAADAALTQLYERFEAEREKATGGES